MWVDFMDMCQYIGHRKQQARTVGKKAGVAAFSFAIKQ